jgi:hypothetical protein
VTPADFPEANRNLTKPAGMTDAECGSLPTFNDGRTCISRWRMTWRERLLALLTGDVWLGVLSGHTQPPVWLAVKRPFEGSWRWRMQHGDLRHGLLARVLRRLGVA